MKIFRTAISCVVVFAVLFSAFYGVAQIGVKPSAVKPTEYKGIITLWQIDSFEGGKGSRKQFLLDTATAFEKSNKGVLVMVITHTKTSAEEDLKNGNYPDMISFGSGVEIPNAVSAKYTHSFKGGNVDKTSYFIPWCKGGYVLITNPKLANTNDKKIDKLLVSQGEYTQPLIALLEQNVTVSEVEVLPPMDAYIKFTANKTPYFLGTQRDVNRLISRGFEFAVTPLSEYNDLYQYVGVTSTDTDKAVYAEKFINFLISDDIQAKLNKIGMFSEFIDVKYEDTALSEMQSVKNEKTISAFTSEAQLKNLQALALNAIKGDEQSKIKIKNIIY